MQAQPGHASSDRASPAHAQQETLGRSMFVGPPRPLPPGGMPPARRKKKKPSWTPLAIRDSEQTLALEPAGSADRQLAPWKEEPVPWRPDELGMVQVGGSSQEMSVPWRAAARTGNEASGAAAGGRKRQRRTVQDVARSWYESMQIQWPPLDTSVRLPWPAWPAWPHFDWPSFGGPARDKAGPQEEEEEQVPRDEPELLPRRQAEPELLPRRQAEPELLPRRQAEPEPRYAEAPEGGPEEEWRPLQDTSEEPGAPKDAADVPRTGRVGSRRYSAMQAGGLYGLIDEGSDGGGARMLLAHVPRKSGHTFIDVRPGERIQVTNPKGGRGVWTLQVAYTGRHRYYSPGAKVTTLRVAVAQDDWLRFLQASGARG